jgi:endoglucanase
VGHTTPPGYIGQVTVTNTGSTAAVGWRVTMSVGSHGRVFESTGADFQQDGSLVTFTPRGETLRLPPGGSVRFTFQVRGPKAEEPTGCAINNRPCG